MYANKLGLTLIWTWPTLHFGVFREQLWDLNKVMKRILRIQNLGMWMPGEAIS